MGYYINGDSKGKQLTPFDFVKDLIADGAEITTPTWKENLICVVENDTHDAALFCYNEDEFNYVINNPDERPKTWLTHPLAKKLSGYEK